MATEPMKIHLYYPNHLPFPYGILIHQNCAIGSGVTIMQDVTIGVKTLDDSEAPMIEDDDRGGCEIAGSNKSRTIGANAVVTKNVPTLTTVAGVNNILHARPLPPGEQTLRLIASMKAAETFDLTMAPAERRKSNHDV